LRQIGGECQVLALRNHHNRIAGLDKRSLRNPQLFDKARQGACDGLPRFVQVSAQVLEFCPGGFVLIFGGKQLFSRYNTIGCERFGPRIVGIRFFEPALCFEKFYAQVVFGKTFVGKDTQGGTPLYCHPLERWSCRKHDHPGRFGRNHHLACRSRLHSCGGFDHLPKRCGLGIIGGKIYFPRLFLGKHGGIYSCRGLLLGDSMRLLF